MTVIGMGTGGTMNRFLTAGFMLTGGTGILIDIGKGKEPGASRAINPDPNHRDGN